MSASVTEIQSIAYFPRQKLSYEEKMKNDMEWVKKSVDSGIALSRNTDASSRRSPYTRKVRNYNLYNGKFDRQDMDFEIQPISMSGHTFPAKLQYVDIVSPIFNLLIGEEAKRGTNYTVLATNEEVTTAREKKQADSVKQALQQYLTSENPQDPKAAIEEVNKYFQYDYKDIESQTGQHILNYLYKTNNLDYQFYKGWEDSLIAGEEVYEVGKIGNEPVARRLNPLYTYFVITKDSDFVDDAEIIVHDTYAAPGRIIDEWYDELSEEQIDEIETLMDNRLPMDASFSLFPPKDTIGLEGDNASYTASSYLDGYGNVRISKCVWKSRKKIGELTYFDEQQVQQKTFIDENYKPNKKNGDIVEWFWINEYWEGTRIKNNIYVGLGPRENQFRKTDNISSCKSGFVGTIYNANNAIAVSLMDRLVPWIYKYITIWYRTDLLIAANQGKIAMIDVSLIPDNWKLEDWMYYASVMKFGFVNSFNESKKGASKGKLAGNNIDRTKALDLETGNAIQHHIAILQTIEQKVNELAGVSKQRQGEIQASEGVGNVQQSIQQSATITEKWFQMHNWTKERVLSALLDVAKDVYTDNPKKLQYITDDAGIALFNVDNTFTESEHGVFVTDSNKDMKILAEAKQFTQAALQNDKADLSDIMEIIMSNNPSKLMTKLKKADQDRRTAAERQQAIQQSIEQGKLDLAKSQREDANWNSEQDRQTKIRIAEIQSTGFEKDLAATELATKTALEERKIAFKEHELNVKQQNESKSHDLEQQRIELDKTLGHKAEDTKHKIAKLKAETDLKKAEKQAKSKPKSK